MPDAEVRRGLKRELRIWAAAGEWVTFSDIGGYAIFSSPLLDERLKQTHVFRGELPLLPVTAPVLETHREREANVIPLFGDHSLPSVVDASGPQLSKGAAALLRFTYRQGRPIRLQEAYNSLSRFGKAEAVKGYAQECVEQRLAKLEENPGYRGSFLFSATGAVGEAI